MLPAVVRTLPLPTPHARAFAAFTADAARWWPTAYTTSGEELADVVVECSAGGRMYEVDRAGRIRDWATVVDCRSPTRLLLAWGLGLDAQRTELELRFTDGADGPRLELEHRGFRAGDEELRRKFDAPGGWDVILEAFRRHVARAS